MKKKFNDISKVSYYSSRECLNWEINGIYTTTQSFKYKTGLERRLKVWKDWLTEKFLTSTYKLNPNAYTV